MKLFTILAVSSLFAVSAFAAASKEGPCKQAKELVTPICESAGFHQGDHKKNGKGLHVDCLHKILEGESVPGVTLTQDAQTAVNACQAHKAKHAAKKAAADAPAAAH